VHSAERLQQKAIELEKQIKTNQINKALARQLIAGAKENVDYSYQKERNDTWYLNYIRELEARL
jgi:hypothetical protein